MVGGLVYRNSMEKHILSSQGCVRDELGFYIRLGAACSQIYPKELTIFLWHDFEIALVS